MKILYKKSLFYLLIIFYHTCSFSNTIHNKGNFILIIDAGHGGRDPGAIGKYGQEKDITLAVSLLAGKLISDQHSNVTVKYTRNNDIFIDLWKRADIANKIKADLFISIHANASHNPLVKGSEVYTWGASKARETSDVAQRENSVIFLEENYKEKYENFDPNESENHIIYEFIENKILEQSLDCASFIRNELKDCVQWPDRGIKQANYLVLKKTTMPRILIELDFITNIEAEQFLLSESGQRQYAKSICRAFTNYKKIYDSKNQILQSNK